GGSLGVCLVGAQQTASEVERRVVANAALKVVGRLDAAEAERGEYGFLTKIARLRASLLQPGTMIVAQPEIPTPILLRFPFPAWATRPSEATTDASARDPFARMSSLMRTVHTSDWHAGRVWKSISRVGELADILEHLGDFVEGKKIDLLLVTGDVFDNRAPAAEAERIVFRFLKRVGRAGTKAVVI